MDFEWDAHKARINLSKHAVSFEEAATVFEDPACMELADPMHSTAAEVRVYRLGRSALVRVLLVVFTVRRQANEQQTAARIISARPASRQEREVYESAAQS